MEPPARFNFVRDVVERQDPARLALRFCDREGSVEETDFPDTALGAGTDDDLDAFAWMPGHGRFP